MSIVKRLYDKKIIHLHLVFSICRIFHRFYYDHCTVFLIAFFLICQIVHTFILILSLLACIQVVGVGGRCGVSVANTAKANHSKHYSFTQNPLLPLFSYLSFNLVAKACRNYVVPKSNESHKIVIVNLNHL